jgi:glycosyl transferase family 1/uncharacterized protein DUF3880
VTGPADERDSTLGADERAALIAAHERRVEALRNSAQYRVGELVIAGFRSPRRLLRLPRDLWRLRKSLLSEHRVDSRSPSRHQPARDLVVATILDEDSQQAIAPEWRQQPLAAGSPAEQLRELRPAMLFVESAWAGNGGAFRDEIAHAAKRPTSPFRAALAAARSSGVPAVFWNTEDPAHFDAFVDAAAGFDWIFTIDADCIDRYVAAAGHDRVRALPFAAQPRRHNPLGVPEQRIARAGYAGSWPTSGDADPLLRPLRDAGLLDVLDHSSDELLAEYRRYACFVDVGPVTTSKTRCPRRVFELLACRTPVVSTPSRAIEELLGDTVITVDTEGGARAAVERLVGDPEHRDRIGHRGYRAVMSRHTYGHRVDDILGHVGIAVPPSQPAVTVLAPTNRPEFLDRLLDNFRRQRDVTADLIVLTNSEQFDRAEVDQRVASVAGARAIHLDAMLTMGECLNAGLAATGARFVAKFDDDDHYGDHYLHDSLLVHRYVDAAIVGKKTFFAYLEGSDETVLRFPGSEFTPANRVSGSTIVIDRNLLPDARFAPLNVGEDIDLCERALERGLVVFSSDRFNYVAVRRRDPRTHSWTIDETDYRTGSVRIASGLALDRTMI